MEGGYKLLLVFFAGLAMGFVNTVSAAGSMISLPALIFMGLPPSVANGSNRVAVIFNSLSSVWGFRSKGLHAGREVWIYSLLCVPGAVLGAIYAVHLPEVWFNRILAVVMLLFLLFSRWNPAAGKQSEDPQSGKAAGRWWFLGTGFYGGFLQAGSGFLLMAGGMLFARLDLLRTNYYKAIITLVYTLAAFPVFLWSGKISWPAACCLALGASAGGWIGSRWSVAKGEKRIRQLVTLVIVLMSFKLLFFGQIGIN